MTYKEGSTTCYSILASHLSGMPTLTVKNASGQTIATGTSDTTTTMTCTGGQPVVLNADCDSALGNTSGFSCTDGTCTP
jgi:hypothetical protein